MRFAFVVRREPEHSLAQSERVLAQLGQATSVTPLSRKRVASMGTTPENVHLVGLAGCFWSPTASRLVACSF